MRAREEADLAAVSRADDPAAAPLVEFLRAQGAARIPHGGGRTLLDHLLATHAILRRWGQPTALTRAALIHSVYGTDAFRHRLLPPSRRDEVIELAGEEAERLAYLFCVTPRGPLLAGTHRWARGLPLRTEPQLDQPPSPNREELDCLILLHMANLADQARARDGSPGVWLVRLHELGELVLDSEAVSPPPFLAALASFTERDEALARRAYRLGVERADDPQASVHWLGLAAATCPVVPEPCAWLAWRAWSTGHPQPAEQWARTARARLEALGTAWDKRLDYEEWLELADGLGRGATEALPHQRGAAPATDPRALLEATRGRLTAAERPATRHRSERLTPPDPATARKRFHHYIETLAEGETLGGIYPGLPSRPWLGPRDIPLARRLESDHAAIREEILALDPSRFHPESERIGRAGDWDVAFFYERGRRHDEVCDACPVTTRVIDSHPAMRTMAGLIYASRMRGGTHIEPHRGPTNLRVRCHLGILVPDGDCGIRVAGETRRWQEGRCLVFDDSFEHEAWNHTDSDRIVLIVDLWHPGLAPTEISLLAGLHDYVYAHARRLGRYWSANAASARWAAGPPPSAGAELD